MGTFSRRTAVQREDLVFFVPGNDPWTEKIIAHALEADRGRCSAVVRSNSELNNSYFVFELFYTVTADPRPLYASGYSPNNLAYISGYLPIATKKVLVTTSGKLVPEKSIVWKVISASLSEKDLRLNDPAQSALLAQIRAGYPLEKWQVVLQQALKVAEKSLEAELTNQSFVVDQARTELELRAFSQRQLANPSDLLANISDQLITEALLEGLKQPYFRLESICLWVLLGKSKS